MDFNTNPEKNNENVSLSTSPHLCTTCIHDVKTCDPNDIVWGVDIDPTAIGENADKIVKCDMHSHVKSNARIDRPARKEPE
jgi:hypothetical protein